MNELSILKVTDLTKKYYNKTAISNISLDFERGKIYGLLGPNGSGKTTFMKVLAGLHKQTRGQALINDEEISYKNKAFVSFMPTENFIYESFTVMDVIKFYNKHVPELQI